MSTTPATDVDIPAIKLEDVTIRFERDRQPFTALDRISLEVKQGEFIALLGPSGCGKSTLLRAVSDLLTPAGGRAQVLGDDPSQARSNRKVGFVFQDSALLPWKNVLENVSLPLEIGPRSARRGGSLSPQEALELVDLGHVAGSYPRQLSGGMRQRVSIARALVTDPKVLLMDEPFGALDEITRDRLNVELLDIWQRSRPTILFVTHSIPEAAFLAQRVVVMAANPGRVHKVVEVPMPYPRDLSMRDIPAMHETVAHLRELLEAQQGVPNE